MSRNHTNLFAALIATAILALATSANAAQFVINYGFEYSGGAIPAGSPPWLVATFDDDAGLAAGHVKLTLEATNLGATEFVSTWTFNLDPALDASNLTIAIIGGSKVGSFDDPGIDSQNDSFGADGAHEFDIEFAFETSGSGGGSKRFTQGDSIMFDISSSEAALLAASFDFGNPSGGSAAKVGLRSGAHVQGIVDVGQGTSGWVTQGDDDDDDDDDDIPGVPAPAALPAGLALLGLAAIRRRRAA